MLKKKKRRLNWGCSLERKIGEVIHYYTDIQVAVIKLEGKLEVGDRIRFKGPTTEFEQDVASMEIEHEKVEAAEEGQKVGLKVKQRVRESDEVYRV